MIGLFANVMYIAQASLAFLYSVIFVAAVDRSKFKTCEQSKFCQRHRNLKTGDTPQFFIDAHTVEVDNAQISAVLIRQDDERKFSLLVTGLTNNRLRVTINEIAGLRPRFRANDALDGEPEKLGFKNPSKGAGSLSVQTGNGHKVNVMYQPFRIDIYNGNADLVASMNAKQLLKIEHFRTKTEATAESDDQHLAEPAGEENKPTDEPDGFWSENFQTHEDRKPFGSSSVGMDVTLMGVERVFGLPEHADSFALKTTENREPYRLYNLDVFEYELNSPMSLYGAVPFIVGPSPKRSIGLLWLNAAETWVDIHPSTADKGVLRSIVEKFAPSAETPQVDAHFISESGLIDIFVFIGAKPSDISEQYSQLTGVTPLPPLFSIAYHQCRWNYNDEDDVRTVHEKFDEHDLPVDVFWLDIEHTDGKRYFTWDPHKFPTPADMQNRLAEKGRKLVVIIDPHIKRDNNYKVYGEGQTGSFFVKDRDGKEYDGHCWSGSSAYLDFFKPEVRDYWATHFRYDKYEGSTPNLFVWNDMNEPSVFSGPEITMHKDAQHDGGWEHRDVHNMYGFQQHRATYQGLYERDNGKARPFVLTRSFFAGSQRYSAVWTGDNMAQWTHLEASIPMMLSLSVAGIPHVGADVGGFFGNPEEQLLVRWYQTGAFSPFFRAHAHIDTKRREPWLFSQDALNHIRTALRRRYALLPYWYTLFYEHEKTGAPVMRPLWYEFPGDVNCYDEEREFMLGNALLVRPVVKPDVTTASVYLPGKVFWYEWEGARGRPGPGAVQTPAPLGHIPVYQRGGTVVPTRERPRRASASMVNDPYTLHVALDYEKKAATGVVYMDDGTSFEYRKGQYCLRNFTWNSEGQFSAAISNKNADANGKLKTDVKVERIIVQGLDFHPETIHIFVDDYNPTELEFDFEREKMLLTIHNLDAPFNSDWRIDVHG